MNGVELRLLGPVEVLASGAWSAPDKPQQRLVMALLALRAGQVVSVDELIDGVWDNDPPRSARASLQALITRLRQMLATVPGSRLERCGDGYRLLIDARRVDVHEFRSLARSGRDCADRRAAIATFDRALTLWRGPALADVPETAAVEAIRSMLAEEHLAAMQDRIGGLLACGMEEEAATELPGVLARHPLAERLAGMLMVALYRCGQRAGALRVFREIRGRLVGELGVEPGPELQEVHRRILVGDAKLAAPAARAAVPAGVGSATTAVTLAGPASLAGTSATAGPTSGIARPSGLPGPSGLAGPARLAGPGSLAGPTSLAGLAGLVGLSGRGGAATSSGLRAPAGLAAPVDAARLAGPPVPRQLPAAPAHFAGRAGELKALSELVAQAASPGGQGIVWVIDGTAGVGKTVLAVHWAHQVAGDFPDGQLYVNLRGFGPSGNPAPPEEALRAMLGALQVPTALVPDSVDAQAALYRSTLAGRRMLIVLDNARDAEQVRPLLPGHAGCAVLVTSRSQLTGLVAAEGAHPLSLDVLSEVDACELLVRRLGAQRVAAEPGAAAELARLCAGLPLALAVAAARADARPGLSLAELAAELRGARGLLDALDTGDAASDVREVFSWSCRQLSAPAARMFRLLGVHRGPDISAAAAASLAGVEPPLARQALAELTRAHLLTEHVPGRFAFHDVLRSYAAEQAQEGDSHSDRTSAVRRVLDHYLQAAHAAALLLYPHRERLLLPSAQVGTVRESPTTAEQARAWFEAERQVLLAAIAQAAEQGFDVHAWQLAWTMRNFLDRQAHWPELAETQLCALAAARRVGDLAGQAHAHRNLGRACLRLGRYDDARANLQTAVDLYRQTGHRYGQARSHFEIAWAAERQGRYGEALAHSRQALEGFQGAGDRHGAAIALNTVGWCQTQLGHHHQALACSRRALAVFLENGHRSGEAAAWDSLGYASHHLGQHQQALACYKRALTLYRQLGDRYNQSQTLVYQGEAHWAAGSPSVAGDVWQQALAILEEMHHPEVGQVRSRLDDLAAARPG
jgi:DNA-binding SARP family transcriptional activator/tetratricopeptide (TPR) repeat protein